MRKAFTVIELLIVISIIAILVAMVVPNLMEHAKQTQSEMNAGNTPPQKVVSAPMTANNMPPATPNVVPMDVEARKKLYRVKGSELIGVLVSNLGNNEVMLRVNIGPTNSPVYSELKYSRNELEELVVK